MKKLLSVLGVIQRLIYYDLMKKRSDFHSAFVYGFLIVKLRPNATIANTRSITNGDIYEPLEMSRLFANVAMKDAKIRLKLIIE